MMAEQDVALWPTQSNYERFRDLCDNEVPSYFEEFESIANSRIDVLRREHEVIIEKMLFDPEAMAIWCRANFGKIDAEARRHYAAVLRLSN